VKKILSSAEYKETISVLTTDQTNLALDHVLFFAVEAGKEATKPTLIEQGASVNWFFFTEDWISAPGGRQVEERRTVANAPAVRSKV
jgi:hypothetical protein